MFINMLINCKCRKKKKKKKVSSQTWLILNGWSHMNDIKVIVFDAFSFSVLVKVLICFAGLRVFSC